MLNLLGKNNKIFQTIFLQQGKLIQQFSQQQNYNITEEKFQFFYGQGGTLNIKSIEPQKNVILETIWEDHTKVTIPTDEQFEDVYGWEDDGDDNCHVEVENKQNQQQISIHQDIIAEIPEYYNYNVETNGDILHRKTYIDSKMQGNAKAKVLSDSGSYKINKVAAEYFEAETINGELSVEKYLEVKQGQLKTKGGNINIKKLLVSGHSIVESESGKINIDSMFTNKNLFNRKFFNLSKIQVNQNNDKQQNIGQEVRENIEKLSEYLIIKSINSDMQLGYTHGNLIIENLQGNIDIKLFNPNIIYINSGKNIDMLLEHIKYDSFINVEQASIRVYRKILEKDTKLKFDIYDIRKQQYLIPHEEQVLQNIPILYIDSSNINIQYL